MSTNLDRFNFGLFNSGTYEPANVDIDDISQAQNAIVTTSEDHSFVIANQVQFLIPPEWGMYQINRLKGFVISIPQSDQIEVDIDTRAFDAFVTPTPSQFVVIDNAQVASVGDANFGKLSPGGVVDLPNTIPGAYINQRP